ncbi:chromate transporter [Paenibacillus sp. LHD-38]|uniref:chromate transporter n=1 Tax=Paenibacillus sp. LHD-38 TaxID=3072143 RepID=UPI00280DEF4E|nr:chromate transporter [Paenibacillus sp. LHD-38]MDQ8737994.1 chromate transporter [Paenibacillus sp. LHD-38]
MAGPPFEWLVAVWEGRSRIFSYRQNQGAWPALLDLPQGRTIQLRRRLFSLAYLSWRDEPKVEAELKGIHSAVIALILMAAYRMAKAAIFDIATSCVTVAALLVLLLTDINPFYVILLGSAVGIVLVKGKQWFGIEVRTERKGAENCARLLETECFI